MLKPVGDVIKLALTGALAVFLYQAGISGSWRDIASNPTRAQTVEDSNLKQQSAAGIVVEPSGAASAAVPSALLGYYKGQSIYADPICASRVIDGVLLTRCYNNNGNFEGGGLYAAKGPNALSLTIYPINGKAKDQIDHAFRWPSGITIGKRWPGDPINISFAMAAIR